MDSLQTLLQYAVSAVNFLIIITVLVFVHELGHFLFAKMFGMHVEAFAVMVGGIRKTDLQDGLPKPLLPARWIALMYLGSLLLTAVAAMQNLPGLYTAALFLVAIVFPLWIGLRLKTLYRYDLAKLAKIYGFSYGIAWIMLGVATKGTGLVNPTSVLLMGFYGSVVAMLAMYYQPLTQKPDDSKMGLGSVDVGDEKREVRYRPVLCRTSKGGTEFSLLALPLGGFAAMSGMHPQQDGSEIHVDRGFYSTSPFARFMVLVAGPLFSIMLGVFLFFVAFASYGKFEVSDKPILAAINPTSAAAQAGLKPDDQILAIDNKATNTFYDIVLAVRGSQGKPLSVKYQRGDETGTVTVTPLLDPDETMVFGPGMKFTSDLKSQYKLGASPPSEMRRLSLNEAAALALTAPVDYAKELGGLIAAPQKAAKNVSGPAEIAKQTHTASQGGLNSLLILAAILSTSLGFMNLLPIPPLDGGQMVVAVAEMFRRGRRLSIETQHLITTVGTFLVVALMLLVFSQDAGKLLGGK